MVEIDQDIADYMAANGYLALRLMPDGSVAGVNKFLFTYGLCTRLDFVGYHARWCFEMLDDALRALNEYDGIGDPPGPWIKQKGPVKRCNPLLFDIVLAEDGREIATPKSTIDMDAVWRIPANPEWLKERMG